MLRVHVFQHAPFEDTANLGAWLQARGASLSTSRLWLGDALPPPASFDWLIVMGGAMNADEEARYPWLADEKRAIERAIAARKRVVGICLGSQLIARVLGAKVTRNRDSEIGWFPIERADGAERSAVGRALPARAEVFHWHGETFTIPAGASRIAESPYCPNQAFVLGPHLAMQCHVEMTPAMIRTWAADSADELDRHRGPSVQTPAEMEVEIEARVRDLNAIARRLYDRWAEGLAR
jgi:GMP synthase (glutamine-hydrolysing)